MRITVVENEDAAETEIVITCKKEDEQIGRICAGLRMFDRRLTGVADGRTYLLFSDEIMYIESVDRKTFLYATEKVYETPSRLYELEERLAGEDFVRVSKSCVLNFNKVRSLRADYGGRLRCSLENGEAIAVSRQYATSIKQKLKFTKG